MQYYWQLSKHATHGAQVAVWVDNSVLLIKNSYRHGYTFPGGHINQNETAIQAAVRELREETGININTNQLQLLNKIHYLRNGAVCSDTIFQCQLKDKPAIFIDHREVIEALFVNPPEFGLLPLQNGIYNQISH